MPRRLGLADAAVFMPRPADMPILHLADRRGAMLAQEAGKPLVAQAAPGGERVGEMMAPVIRHLLAQGDGDGHLRHDGGAAAPNEAAIDHEHVGARRIGCNRRCHAGRARADHQHVRRKLDRFRPHHARIDPRMISRA